MYFVHNFVYAKHQIPRITKDTLIFIDQLVNENDDHRIIHS